MRGVTGEGWIWITAPRLGSGTVLDPVRPDLSGITGVRGHAVVAEGEGEFLVLVRLATAEAEEQVLDQARGLRRHTEADPEGAGRPLLERLRLEAKRLGLRGVDRPVDAGRVLDQVRL